MKKFHLYAFFFGCLILTTESSYNDQLKRIRKNIPHDPNTQKKKFALEEKYLRKSNQFKQNAQQKKRELFAFVTQSEDYKEAKNAFKSSFKTYKSLAVACLVWLWFAYLIQQICCSNSGMIGLCPTVDESGREVINNYIPGFIVDKNGNWHSYPPSNDEMEAFCEIIERLM